MKISFLKNFEIYFSRKIIVVLLMGIASGLPLVLLGSTLSAWLNDYGIDKKIIGLFTIVGMPYSLKFLWAPFLDKTNIAFLSKFLGHRKSWMVLIQSILISLLMIIGYMQPEYKLTTIAVFSLFIAFLSATQDDVIDAYRIEILDDNEQGAGSAMAVFGYRIGMLISGFFTLILVDFFKKNLNITDSWGRAYFLMGTILAILSLLIIVISHPIQCKKEKVNKKTTKDVRQILKDLLINPFLDITKHKNWFLILSFVAFFKLGDAFASSLLTPFLTDIGFTLSQIALTVKMFGVFAVIFGAFLGGVLVYRAKNIMSLIFFCAILQSVTNSLYIFQHYLGNNIYGLYFTISVENVSAGIGSAVFVAYISKLCNKKYTATQYALLTSIASIGRTTIASLGGFAVNRFGWDGFFILSIILSLPSIFITLYLRNCERRNNIVPNDFVAV